MPTARKTMVTTASATAARSIPTATTACGHGVRTDSRRWRQAKTIIWKTMNARTKAANMRVADRRSPLRVATAIVINAMRAVERPVSAIPRVKQVDAPQLITSTERDQQARETGERRADRRYSREERRLGDHALLNIIRTRSSLERREKRSRERELNNGRRDTRSGDYGKGPGVQPGPFLRFRVYDLPSGTPGWLVGDHTPGAPTDHPTGP